MVSFCTTSDDSHISRNILVPIDNSDQFCSDIFLQIDGGDKYYQLEGEYPQIQSDLSDLDCANQGDVNKKDIQGLIRKRRSDLKKIRDLKLDLSILLFISSSGFLVFFCKDKIQSILLQLKKAIIPSREDEGYNVIPAIELV